MYEGEVVGQFDPKTVTVEELGLTWPAPSGWSCKEAAMDKKPTSTLLDRSLGGLSSVAAALIAIVIGLALGLVVLLALDAQHAWKDGFVPILQAGFRNATMNPWPRWGCT